MNIFVACPHCRQQISIDANHAGQIVACTFCGGHIQTPPLAPTKVKAALPPVAAPPRLIPSPAMPPATSPPLPNAPPAISDFSAKELKSRRPPRKLCGEAVKASVFGLLGVICFPLGIVGIIFGIQALNRIRNPKFNEYGRGFALFGIVAPLPLIVLGIVGAIVIRVNALQENATVNEWQEASQFHKSEFIENHAKYSAKNEYERRYSFDAQCKSLGIPKKERYRVQTLDFSDSRLNVTANDIDDICSREANRDRRIKEIIKEVELVKEKQVLAMQKTERAQAVEHERELAESRKREEEHERERQRELANAIERASITMYKYQLIGATPYTDKESISRLLGVKGVERASSGGFTIVEYRGVNGVVVTVTYQYEKGEEHFESKAQFGL